MTLPRSSRTLLLPGPQPPGSHLGVTLLRHVVATGLRSALHRLGLPLIATPPVRIVRLRLYLDRAALERQLGGQAGAPEALAALLDPGGSAAATPGGSRLSGAALAHRLRLRRAASLPRPRRPGDRPHEELRPTLSALLPALSDALLAEILASLSRRRDRARGRRRPPCLGRQAWRYASGRPADLHCLGPAEPLLRSWAEVEPPAAPAAEPPPCHRLRGRFREQYRAALDRLAPILRRLAEQATERGILEDPSDAFFLPLDLVDDLAADRRPDWLPGAVATNRHEYIACRTAPSPPEILDPDAGDPGRPADWATSPLNPLP